MFKPIIGPHNHPLSLDSGNTVKYFIRTAAKDFGRPAIALTDHGTLGSIIEAHEYTKELKKKEDLDITIIPGIELYLLPSEHDLKTNPKLDYYHVTVHFADFQAYLDGCKLSRSAYERSVFKGGELKPLTTWEELESLSGRVTLFSSCLVGCVLKPWLKGYPEIAEANFLRLKRIAGPGKFFAEIFPYEVSKNWNRKTKKFEPIPPSECSATGRLQVDANKFIMHLSKKHSVPMVVSEDAHYAHESEKFIQDVRLNKDGQDNWKMSDANCLHDSEWLFKELNRMHPEIDQKMFEEMVDNSYATLDNFKGFDAKFKPSLPKVIVNHDNCCKELSTDKELVNYFLDKIQALGRVNLKDPVYLERMKKEINQLALNGKINILPYFEPLTKIIDFCREKGITVGPGRGSAAGSLFAYALGITSVDPVAEGLSFERFFDVSRVEEGLADIDTDFSDKDAVIEFIKETWGDKFAYLGIGSTFKTKTVLKDVDRLIFGHVRKETEEVCKTIPNSPQGASEEDFLKGFTDADGIYHEGQLEQNEKLLEYLKKNKDHASYLFKMVGIIRQMGRHACGVVITDRPVHEFIPVQKVSGEITTQLLPKWVEKSGGVKYDILGLHTLKDIGLCVRLIKDRHGIEIDPWKIKDDPKFWEAMAKDPVTVFQLHTVTVREGVQRMRPKTAQEAAVLTSVFRPGAMDAPSDEDENMTMSDIFLDRWEGKRPVRYVHPDLEPILKRTAGVCVFQEDLMKIVHEIGGLSMPETQKFRKAISKKAGNDLIELLNKVQKHLVEVRNWTPEQAAAICDQMKASGKYAFNLSHALSYSYVARACAYFKYYYPNEWWSAVLTNSSKDDLKKYWPHVAKDVLNIDIQKSGPDFMIVPTEEGEKLLSPLSIINGLAADSKATESIIANRPYTNIQDFVDRVDRSKVNRAVVFKLILSGAMDSLFPAGTDHMVMMQDYLKAKAKAEGKKTAEPVPSEYLSLTPLKTFLMKKKIFKMYSEEVTPLAINKLKALKRLSDFPGVPGMFLYNNPDPKARYAQTAVIDTNALFETLEEEQEQVFTMIAFIQDTEEFKYQNNQKTAMKFIVEAGDQTVEFVKWPEFGENKHNIVADHSDSIAVLTLKKAYGRHDASIVSYEIIEDLMFLKEEKEKRKSKKT